MNSNDKLIDEDAESMRMLGVAKALSNQLTDRWLSVFDLAKRVASCATRSYCRQHYWLSGDTKRFCKDLSNVGPSSMRENGFLFNDLVDLARLSEINIFKSRVCSVVGELEFIMAQKQYVGSVAVDIIARLVRRLEQSIARAVLLNKLLLDLCNYKKLIYKYEMSFRCYSLRYSCKSPCLSSSTAQLMRAQLV